MSAAIANKLSAPATAARSRTQESSAVLTANQEEALLKLDLTDLVLPKVNNLEVDGMQRSWLSRLLGR